MDPRYKLAMARGTMMETAYQRLTGKKLQADELAVAIPVQVSVIDPVGNRSSNIEFSILGIGPKSDWLRSSTTMSGAEDESDSPAALEKRLRRIEVAIDAILEKVDSLNSKQQ